MNSEVVPLELPPRYYLGNFEQLLGTVAQQYADLLSDNDRQFLARFRAASEPLRCLYVRLVSRRGRVFRSDRLAYAELGDLSPAIQEGFDSGLLAHEQRPDFSVLATLLRKDELLEIYGDDIDGAGRLSRADLLMQINAAYAEDRLLALWQAWACDAMLVLRPLYSETVDVFKLLFFGNSYQDLTEFVLSDMGYARYAPYPLDPEARLFTDREEVDEYLALNELKSLARTAVASQDSGTLVALGRSLLAPACGATAQGLRNRLRLRVARQLERDGFVDESIALYAVCDQHPARQRLTRLLANRDEAAALSLCSDIAANPWCEAERDFARRTMPTLSRKLGLSHQSIPRDAFDLEKLTLAQTNSVEAAAATYYEQQWAQVWHIENWLFNASFGLAFWEQIFAPVTGAFVNPFQAAPLDMYTADFYGKRHKLIDQRLAELEQVDLNACLLSAYDRYSGTTNTWVAWRGGLRPILEAALAIIPRAHWLAVWRRQLFDPEANRNGFPDLLLLDAEQGYRLIEVKGPGDQLQQNQRRWLRYFQQQGIPATVCKVSWSDDGA